MSDCMDSEPLPTDVSFDSDGDGVIDTTVTDFDGDGVADMIVTEGSDGLTAFLDQDLSGSYETVLLDHDGDGVFESELTDNDGDGVLDTIAVDLDGDGVPDTLEYLENETSEELPVDPASAPHVIADTSSPPPPPGSSDLVDAEEQPSPPPDVMETSYEDPGPTTTVADGPEEPASAPHVIFDGDTAPPPPGSSDTVVNQDPGPNVTDGPEEPASAPHVTADRATAPPPPGSSDTTDNLMAEDPTDTIWGDPAAESDYWFNQAQNGFCVPASVAQIVSEFTGQAVFDDTAFAQRAIDLGLLTENGRFGRWSGMTTGGAEMLLESFGVEAEVATGDLQGLAAYLDSGHDVILFVDSSEVWTGVDDDAAEPAGTDHALVVTGIDFENGVAYLSDPGDPNGNGRAISLDLLDDAWADGNRQMVVTSAPAPGVNAGAGLVSAGSSGVVLLPVVLDDEHLSAGGRRAP